MHRRSILWLFVLGFIAIPTIALSQTPASAPATQEQIAALQKAVESAQSAGDNAWMLTSAAEVSIHALSPADWALSTAFCRAAICPWVAGADAGV